MAERQVASRQIPTTTTINEAENTAQTKYQMTSDEDFAGVSDKSSNETFYYYHHVMEAFRMIQERDSLSDTVFPEVRVR